MDDLISRKALIQEIRNTITESSDTFDWVNMINRQPIAYDVDKVADELEHYFEKVFGKGATRKVLLCITVLEIIKRCGKNETN